MIRPTAQTVTHFNGKTVGIIYMAFGLKASTGVRRSVFSLRRLGTAYPVTVVGDRAVAGCDFIKWEGQSPFDMNQRRNFKFRAGRIKPKLYDLSPYEYTLYVDADTQFIRPVESGFSLLSDYDIAVTEEKLTLAQLYNKQLAGWEINIQERDTTMQEIGSDGSEKFINSGVMFFRKNANTAKLFRDWHTQWLRFQEWDEQLSLIRALHANPKVKVERLPVIWNAPQSNEKGIIIFHNYGRGTVRTNL